MATLFFSDRIELLVEKLSTHLFSYKENGFSPKYVILPHPAFKDWLYHRFALQRACVGLHFFSLQEALFHFQKRKQNFPPLSSQELFWRLLAELKNPLSQEQIFEYLQGSPPIGDCSKEKKVADLAYYTAQLFTLYGIYGKPERKGSWQDFFWDKIFSKSYATSPFELAKQPIYEVDREIHLFHFSEIPPVFLEYFSRFSEKNTVFFYFFSPCKDFWEEELSDFELKKIQKTLSPDLFKQYFSQRHPLLANWGKLGRNLLKQLDRYDWEIQEHYSNNLYPKTLLEQIREDFLQGFPSQKKQKKDDSLHIYAAGSCYLKEIQILHHLICKKVEKEKTDPSSILILAPDMDKYVPFIHFVFADSFFDYKIFSTSFFFESLLLQGFFLLLQFLQKKGDPSFFFSLLENPLFSKKHSLGEKEVLQIKKWIEEGEIREGFQEGKIHGWKNGLERLLKGATFYLEDPFFSSLDFSQIDLVTKWLALLQKLEKEALFLVDPEREEFPAKWAIFCETLLQNFFCIKEEEASFSLFQKLLLPLKKEEEKKISFYFVFYYLKKYLEKKPGRYHSSYLESLTFSSLIPSSSLWAKHIFVLGMEEDSFLQKELFSSSYEPKMGLFPKEEKERYAFLQLFFQAEESLYFLYKNREEEEGETLFPSLVLEELLCYLEEFYSLKKEEMISSFSPLFENTPSPLRKIDRSLTPRKIAFQPPAKQQEAFPFSVSLKEFTTLSKNPFRFFFQKKNLYLPPEKQEKEFFFPPWKRSVFRSSFFHQDFEENISYLQRQGKFPSGIFEDLEIEKAKEEEKCLESALNHFSLKKESIFSLPLQDCFLCYENQKILLEGTIPFICEEGILCFAKETRENLFAFWPYVLLLHHPFLKEKGIRKQLLFTKSESIKKISLENIEQKWEKWLEYYLFARKNPSIFFPPLLKGIVSTKEVFLSLVEKEKNKKGFVDPYFSWFFQQEYELFEWEKWSSYLTQLTFSDKE